MKRDASKAWGNESLHHHYLREAAGGRFAQAGGSCVRWHFAIPSQDWLHGRWQQHGPGCGIVQRLPQEPQSPSESARADQREGYHRLL